MRMHQVMIPTVNHPAAVQQLILCSSIHVSKSAPEGTAIWCAAACLTKVIAARARDAREMYSVSIVSIGAERGRPPEVFDVQQITQHQRFPSRCFVIESAGVDCPTDLLDPPGSSLSAAA